MGVKPALEDARKRLKDGVRIIGVLLAAAAVMRLLARATGLPLRDWLAAILDAYAELMHPIVDHTIGIAPLLFGYELLPAARDAIVLHFVLAGSLYRAASVFVARFQPPGEPPGLDWEGQVAVLAMAMLWPVVLPLIAAAEWGYRQRLKDLGHWENGSDADTPAWRRLEPFRAEIPARDRAEVAAMKGEHVSLRDFFRELLFIAAAVASCMLLNAAGVIGLPD